MFATRVRLTGPMRRRTVQAQTCGYDGARKLWLKMCVIISRIIERQIRFAGGEVISIDTSRNV
jgi:hypothetical protein